MTAIACAFALWGLLAFAAFVLWLRAQKPPTHPLETRVEGIWTHVQSLADACAAAEERRRKLSKRVGDLEFRSLGKRMTPVEDDS